VILLEAAELVIGDKVISRNGKFDLGFFQPSPGI
jgi:hypothetical protein